MSKPIPLMRTKMIKTPIHLADMHITTHMASPQWYNARVFQIEHINFCFSFFAK